MATVVGAPILISLAHEYSHEPIPYQLPCSGTLRFYEMVEGKG